MMQVFCICMSSRSGAKGPEDDCVKVVVFRASFYLRWTCFFHVLSAITLQCYDFYVTFLKDSGFESPWNSRRIIPYYDNGGNCMVSEEIQEKYEREMDKHARDCLERYAEFMTRMIEKYGRKVLAKIEEEEKERQKMEQEIICRNQEFCVDHHRYIFHFGESC